MFEQPILVTGSTGYIGGRLIPRLLEAGYKVRAVGRSLDKLRSRAWASHENIELVSADVFDVDSLIQAAQGCDAAYYLVHSMNAEHRDFAKADRQAAQNMADAATKAGLKRIIYLSGLGEDQPNLSKHLKSRAEVARILQAGAVSVTILRAAMIIGSGSASFEILRYLVDRLPVMITPLWVDTPCQPIAVRNALGYLVSCLDNEETIGKTFDIGGPEVLTYRLLMQMYAEEAGLAKRWVIPVPVFTPKLSSYWIHFVTPVPASLARPLAEGLKNPVVCQENRIRDLIPQPLLSCREAIRWALDRMKQQQIETHWTDAGSIHYPEFDFPGDAHWAGGTLYTDSRRMVVETTPEALWKPVIHIGGVTGWYYGNWLWQLRGALDLLLGGVGLKRGRRYVDRLMPGDALDFWRVVKVEEPKQLLLLAEMKVPGEALLEFRLNPLSSNQTEILQTARYFPRGLLGILYWWAVTPFHHFVFNGMLRGIVQADGQKIVTGPEKL